METTQALVKVSKESHIKFNGIGAIRAISLADASAILASKRIDFVVFEEILPEEVEAVKALRNDYRVPMFTFGSSVVEGIENFVSLSDLQDSIEGTTGIWVATYGTERSPRLWNKQFDEYGNEVPILELKNREEAEKIEEVAETELDDRTELEAPEEAPAETAETETDKGTETESTEEVEAEIKDAETPTAETKDIEPTTAEIKDAEPITAEVAPQLEDNSDLLLSLKTELDYYKKMIKSLETNGSVMEVEKLTEDCLRFEQQIADLKTKPVIDEEAKKKQEAVIAELKQELETSKQEIEELNDSLELTGENLKELEKYLTEATEKSADRKEQLALAKTAFDKMTALALRYKGLLSTKQEQYEGLLAKYTEVLDTKGSVSSELSSKELEIEELQRKLSESQRTANLKFTELDNNRAELQNQLSRLEIEKDELGVQKLDYESKLAELESSLNVLQQSKDILQEELADTQESLSVAQQTIEKLNAQINTAEEDVVKAREYKEELGITNETVLALQKEIGKLQIQLKETDRLSTEKDKQIGTLLKAKSDAERTAKSFSRSATIGGDVNLTCRYTGNGYILPIFGSGSYGITTAAVSMAKKLHKEGNSVCILDFDLVNPKINSFFNKNPLLDYQEEGLDRMKCSCMGLLVEKGTAWFVDHRGELLQTLEQNKKTGKRLDYFSGLYIPVETPKFVSIDYTELFNVLGNDYNFLIVDLGKIGGSDAQNALIRLLTTVSLKTTVVCLKEKDDIRNLFVKAQYNKLDTKKFVWLLNMAADTGVTDFMKTMFKLMPYRTVTFNSSMYGTHKTFGTTLIRGMFDELVEDLILKQ